MSWIFVSKRVGTLVYCADDCCSNVCVSVCVLEVYAVPVAIVVLPVCLYVCQPVQFSSVLVRGGVPTLQEVNREYRRVSHITAEQRRRGSIKVHYDRLASA